MPASRLFHSPKPGKSLAWSTNAYRHSTPRLGPVFLQRPRVWLPPHESHDTLMCSKGRWRVSKKVFRHNCLERLITISRIRSTSALDLSIVGRLIDRMAFNSVITRMKNCRSDEPDAHQAHPHRLIVKNSRTYDYVAWFVGPLGVCG